MIRKLFCQKRGQYPRAGANLNDARWIAAHKSHNVTGNIFVGEKMLSEVFLGSDHLGLGNIVSQLSEFLPRPYTENT